MATLDGTLDDFTYMPTTEKIDTYNEVHYKLVDFNLQFMFVDREFKKLIQECRERKEILEVVTGVVKEDQESRKPELQKILMMFFMSKCFFVDNLESFILEQEVYNSMMSGKNDYELNLFKTDIGRWFTRAVNTSYYKINFLNMVFDRTPRKLKFITCNFGQSADRARSCQPQGLRDRSRGDTEMSLSDVVVELYRFSRDMALDIQECVASRTLVSEAFKNNSMSENLHRNGSRFDPMDYLDHQVLSDQNCKQEPEDAEALNWENVTIMREKLEDLYQAILCYEDEQNVDMVSVCGFCVENILKAMKVWIFHMESVLCDLIYNLYAMMSDYEPAMKKFQEFQSELKQDKERNNGMEAVIVYKILAMPRISCQGVGLNCDKAVLHEEMGFDGVILLFKNIIKHLESVLSKSSELLNAQRTSQRELMACQLFANIADELMKELGMRIYGAKSRLKELQDASITKEKTSASLTQTCIDL